MAYIRNGITLPRCTDIISDSTNKSGGLVQWSANCVVEWIRNNSFIVLNQEKFVVSEDDLNKARFAYKTVSQTALDVGSEVHHAIEMHLQHKDYTLTSKQAENGFQAFLEWAKDVELKPISLEQTVFGDRWAGTCDFYGYYKGELYVIDWKTSKAFYLETMGAQIAAYRSCFPEAVGCGVLRLDKETGLPEWKDFSKRYESDLAVFNGMVSLYYLRHKQIRKRFEGGFMNLYEFIRKAGELQKLYAEMHKEGILGITGSSLHVDSDKFFKFFDKSKCKKTYRNNEDTYPTKYSIQENGMEFLCITEEPWEKQDATTG